VGPLDGGFVGAGVGAANGGRVGTPNVNSLTGAFVGNLNSLNIKGALVG
jgi:hypothetical protein